MKTKVSARCHLQFSSNFLRRAYQKRSNWAMISENYVEGEKKESF